MNKVSTGYVIKPEVDLATLTNYGFYKTSPKDINPWWQRPFNMSLDVFIMWTCELLVNRDDRELLIEIDDGANTDKLYTTIDKMLKDGILEKKENIK